MRVFLNSLAITAGLAALAWYLRTLPPQDTIFIRLFNGFTATTLLVYVVLLGLDYSKKLDKFLEVVLELVRRGEEARKQDLTDLVKETANIAARLHDENREKAEVLAKLQTEQSEKIDAIKSVGEETNELIKKVHGN